MKNLFTLSPCPEWQMFVFVHWHCLFHHLFEKHKSMFSSNSNVAVRLLNSFYRKRPAQTPFNVCTNRQPKLYWILNIDFKLHKTVLFIFIRLGRIACTQRSRAGCNDNTALSSCLVIVSVDMLYIKITVRILNSCKPMYNNEGKKKPLNPCEQRHKERTG